LEQHPKLENMHEDTTISALIWTTTPWTLPANQAVALNPSMFYSVIRLLYPNRMTAEQDLLLVAEDGIEHVLSFLPEGTTANVVIDNLVGEELHDGREALWNPFRDEESYVVLADFVTSNSGTGVVHMAPGHGMEDYLACQEAGDQTTLAPADDDGRFTAEAFPAGGHSYLLSGLDVQTDGVKAVLDILKTPNRHFGDRYGFAQSTHDSFVLATHEFVHKNPIDWRTKQPVIVRATAQWFADVSAIKERALSALKDVTFTPEGGRTRLQSFVDGRSQWCISRQRAWGVPIPVLYHRDSGEACITPESIEHIINTMKVRGTDAWFSDPQDDPSWIHSSIAGGHWIRGKDTMDVWFDSGTTWTTLSGSLGNGLPISDVYLEGTDQHRGWFQSSLLTHVAIQEADGEAPARAPFRHLITHGFTLDADGRKMSKSLGNVVSPDQILDGTLLPPVKPRKQRGKNKTATVTDGDGQTPKYDAMGPDALRLWVASSDYTRDVSISVPVLQSVQQALQKYRVTFKFLLGVLADYNPAEKTLADHRDLTFADHAVLYQLANTQQEVWNAYDQYKFYKAVSDINTFINNDLSAFYFEVIKDTMYAGSKHARLRTQMVLRSILDGLLKMLGPVTPHLVEEVWENCPKAMKNERHPLKRVWPEGKIKVPGNHERVEEGLDVFYDLSAAVKLAQEEARQAGNLRSGLACKIEVHLPDTPERHHIERWFRRGELADLLVVSQVSVRAAKDKDSASNAAWSYDQLFEINGDEGKVVVLPPDHHKCVRCWKYTAVEAEQPCGRCRGVLREQGFSHPDVRLESVPHERGQGSGGDLMMLAMMDGFPGEGVAREGGFGEGVDEEDVGFYEEDVFEKDEEEEQDDESEDDDESEEDGPDDGGSDYGDDSGGDIF